MCVLGEDEARDLVVAKKPYVANQWNIQAESQTCPFLRGPGSDSHNHVNFYISNDGGLKMHYSLPTGVFDKLL